MTYFTDHLRWLCIVDRFDVLGHCAIIVALLIEVITVFPVYDVLLLHVHSGLLCQADSQWIQVSLVEQVESLLERLLVVSVDLMAVSFPQLAQLSQYVMLLPCHLG